MRVRNIQVLDHVICTSIDASEEISKCDPREYQVPFLQNEIRLRGYGELSLLTNLCDHISRPLRLLANTEAIRIWKSYPLVIAVQHVAMLLASDHVDRIAIVNKLVSESVSIPITIGSVLALAPSDRSTKREDSQQNIIIHSTRIKQLRVNAAQ